MNIEVTIRLTSLLRTLLLRASAVELLNHGILPRSPLSPLMKISRSMKSTITKNTTTIPSTSIS